MTALLLVCMALADGPTVSDAAGDIRIDGSLDEPAWQAATPVTEFQRFQPTKGGVPPGTTEVRFLQDDRNLYVGVRVRDANYKVRARISRREDINADDQVGVYLDTFRDGRTGYIFYFNGRGIQQDIRVGPGFSSFSWNTVLRTKGQATDDGYTLEVAIPWRSVKYPNPNDETQTWGVILTRKIPSEGAKYSYPVTERGHPRLFTQAAPLTGVKPPKRGSGLELIPSLTLIQQAARDDADELKWLELPTSGPDALPSWSRVVRPSLDLRLGLTPNLGLAATINPDFSQVDQDPTFINLNQRFAFFLPERRPFFLDGTEYFADQQGSLYSRSIVDPLYGLKLSGRAGPVSMGVLHSLDRNPGRTVNERGTPGFDEEDVQDTQALNEVARVRLDAFGDGYVGATIIDKRLINGDGQLSGVHTAAGMDTRVPLSDRWTVDGRMIHSLTGPSYDNAIWGQEVGLGIARASGIGWGVRANATDVTPGHRRETGFLNQSGITYLNSALDYTFEPSGMVDTVRPSLSASARIERNGEQQQFVGAGSEVLLGGIHRFRANVALNRIREGIDGGPATRPTEYLDVLGPNVFASYGAELGRIVAVYAEAGWRQDLDFQFLDRANSTSVSSTLTLRPTAGIRLDTTVRGDRLDRPRESDAQAALIRHWTSWQFTQELGLRSMIEYSAGNERDDRLVTTVLLTWLENPGTAVHLGWIERTGLEDQPKTLDRTVFLKASVLFRP